MHVSGEMIQSIIVDKGSDTPQLTLECKDSLTNVWLYSMLENNIKPFSDTLPLMSMDRYETQSFGLIVDISRSHTLADSTAITDSVLEVSFNFKVSGAR